MENKVPTFEDFWSAYPLHRAKKDAQKAWNRLSVQHKREAVAALPSYSEYCRQKGIGIKYAQGWLNGQRWEDEYDNATAAPSPIRSDVHIGREVPVEQYRQETLNTKTQLQKAWRRHMSDERDRMLFQELLSSITIEEVNVQRRTVLLSANKHSLSREFAIPYFWEPSDFDRIIADNFGGFRWTDNKNW